MGKKQEVNSKRTVLDTNVLVSALLFQDGRLTWLRKAWHSKQVVPLASVATTTELLRVLTYPKFGLNTAEQHELLDDYLPFCESIPITYPTPDLPECRDEFDQMFLELALVGHADVIVTGDADLLAQSKSFSIPIVSPSDLKSMLN